MDALSRQLVDAKVQFLVGEYGLPCAPVLTVLKARPSSQQSQVYWDPNGLLEFCGRSPSVQSNIDNSASAQRGEYNV